MHKRIGLKNRYFNVVMRGFLLFVSFIISGCSAHHASSFPQHNLKQARAQYAVVPQGRIEYYQFGSGSPIILIAGYASDVSSWDSYFLAGLAKHHQVIVINNRNVGGSFIHSSQYETKDLATDIYQLILALKLKKPAVLGISMGGMIAQQLAALHASSLGQLILINTAIAGKQAVKPSSDIEKKMLNMPTDKWGRYTLAVDIFFPASWRMQMAYALVAHHFQPQELKEVKPACIMPSQSRLVMHWIEDQHTAMKIKKISLPVLILNGEADVIIPPVNSEILFHTIPHAQLWRWREGGHAMIYQYPEVMANTVNRFINETS